MGAGTSGKIAPQDDGNDAWSQFFKQVGLDLLPEVGQEAWDAAYDAIPKTDVGVLTREDWSGLDCAPSIFSCIAGDESSGVAITKAMWNDAHVAANTAFADMRKLLKAPITPRATCMGTGMSNSSGGMDCSQSSRIHSSSSSKSSSNNTSSDGRNSSWPLSVSAPCARADYLIGVESRPVLRGALVGWLHGTQIWLALVTAHLGLAIVFLGPSLLVIFPRVALGAATWWCTWLSDMLHNLDIKMGSEADVKLEFKYYRLDRLSISVILFVQFLLWAANMAWPIGTPAGAVMSGLIMLLVTAALFHSEEKVMKHQLHISRWINLGYMGQFVLVGWLGYLYVFHTHCGFATYVWFVYAPGFMCFASKPFFAHDRFTHFGPHEWFHTLVYAGHLTTMGIDLYMCMAQPPCVAHKIRLFDWP